MENSPLSNQVDIRLKQLDREIHSSLRTIRRHIQELEEVEQRTRHGGVGTPEKTGQSFADHLNDALDEGSSSPWGGLSDLRPEASQTKYLQQSRSHPNFVANLFSLDLKRPLFYFRIVL